MARPPTSTLAKTLAVGITLVIGATGLTGGALARELICRQRYVRALVRNLKKAQALADAGVELIEGDVRDPDAVDRATAGCEYVYHLAAVYRTAGHPDSYYQDVNVKGVANVLAAARRHGVKRTVHCSTVGVHGDVSELPSAETAPYNPGDIYQTTKLAGERLAQRAIADGQPVSIVRPSGIYGPGDLRFLKLFKGIQFGTFRVFGDGKTLYHPVYIDDVVEGLIQCCEHPAAEGQIFIICGDEYVSLDELVKLVAEAVGVRTPRGHLPLWPLMTAARMCEGLCRPLGIDPPLHRRRADFFVKNRAFTNAKARRLLGYRPRVALAEGIQRTAEWYVQEKLLK